VIQTTSILSHMVCMLIGPFPQRLLHVLIPLYRTTGLLFVSGVKTHEVMASWCIYFVSKRPSSSNQRSHNITYTKMRWNDEHRGSMCSISRKDPTSPNVLASTRWQRGFRAKQAGVDRTNTEVHAFGTLRSRRQQGAVSPVSEVFQIAFTGWSVSQHGTTACMQCSRGSESLKVETRVRCITLWHVAIIQRGRVVSFCSLFFNVFSSLKIYLNTFLMVFFINLFFIYIYIYILCIETYFQYVSGSWISLSL